MNDFNRVVAWSLVAVGALTFSVDVSLAAQATFTDGSILTNGSSSWPGGNDFASAAGTVTATTVSGSGSTSGGLVEATASLTGTITQGAAQTSVALDGSASASMPPGYDGFAFLQILTSDTSFTSDPLRLTITNEAIFTLSNPGNVTVQFTPQSGTGAAFVGNHMLAGSYLISFNMFASISGGTNQSSKTLDWTLTLNWSLCPADVAPPGGNGTVNVDDLLKVINTWGTAGAGDVNGNGIVNVDDLLAVINAWGSCS